MGRAAFVMIGVLAFSASVLGRQEGARPLNPSGGPAAVSPAEIQRMFDAYALVQAQDQLNLGDEQYPRFLARYKALQETRRRSQAERGRAIQELRRLALDAKSDESLLKDRMKALQDLDVRSAAEIRKAQEAVDQVLDVRQQARFRGFEELMERRKIELMTRARQNNRQNGRAARGQP